MDDREQKIRERAHELWEQEGRPDGRGQEHWARAVQEIDEEERAQNESGGEAQGAERETLDGDLGSASPLQPGGVSPAGGPGAGMGGVGTGGGSTGGAATGAPGRRRV